ncbi:MAG TPA: YlmC/YmxH family sporulation protein [Tissierellales bacterium]|nr:YlmC/YmxH family sporulation protein [Tissierellales bacterium]
MILLNLYELGGKEIVNLNNGERLGNIAEADIVVDKRTGKIQSLLMPDGRMQFKLFGERNDIEIPWDSIRKIGNDMIIIELDI